MQEIAHSAELSRGSLLKLQCSDSKSLEGITSAPPYSWEQRDLVSSNSDCRNTVISYGTWVRISSALSNSKLGNLFSCCETMMRKLFSYYLLKYLLSKKMYSFPEIWTLIICSYVLMIHSSGLLWMKAFSACLNAGETQTTLSSPFPFSWLW